MKFDQHECLIREKYPEGEKANLGDACAETCRLYILGGFQPRQTFVCTFSPISWQGFLRHPSLYGVPGWGTEDYTNDQLVPLMMAQILQDPAWMRRDLFTHFGFIKGTWKLLQPATFAILGKHWRLLDWMNRLQGFFLGLPFRWSDDESEGAGFKSSSGKVQDYLNMIAIYVFLRLIGYKAKLPRPINECMKAVETYYLKGDDFEPNSEWIVDLYFRRLRELEPSTFDHKHSVRL